jgi:hypothetical protein
MLNNTINLDEQVFQFDEDHPILPTMTAAFVKWLDHGSPMLSSSNVEVTDISGNSSVKIIQLPPRKPINNKSRKTAFEARAFDALPRTSCRNADIPDPVDHRAVRDMIYWISHHFNNLLMGILGNATLIRLLIDADDPLTIRLKKMEKLIQSGAFLIHMVLGYLGERRTAARDVRLKQIIQEIREDSQSKMGKDDFRHLEKRLQCAAGMHHPEMIAASTAGILAALFERIHIHHRMIKTAGRSNPDIQKKINRIEMLVKKSHTMIQRLYKFEEIRIHKTSHKINVPKSQTTGRVSRLRVVP